MCRHIQKPNDFNEKPKPFCFLLIMQIDLWIYTINIVFPQIPTHQVLITSTGYLAFFLAGGFPLTGTTCTMVPVKDNIHRIYMIFLIEKKTSPKFREQAFCNSSKRKSVVSTVSHTPARCHFITCSWMLVRRWLKPKRVFKTSFVV